MMTGEQRLEARQRLKPEPRPVALVPVEDVMLQRLDALIEHLLELRDLLDGDQDLEPEHHDGAAVFPGHALYEHCDLLAMTENGPGDPSDAEAETDEDSDADEWSGVIKTEGGAGLNRKAELISGRPEQ
jgi:hypothetical protein